MQNDLVHLASRKFEGGPIRCATTSTSNGVINLDLDEEWLVYEKLTEITLFRPEKNPFVPRPLSWRKEDFESANVSQRRCVKLTKHKSNVPKNGAKRFHIIFDKRADGDKAMDTKALPIRHSLFPNVPPYILFNGYDEVRLKRLPEDFVRLLKWKFTMPMPRILIKILINSGYRVVNRGHDWSGIWNLCIKDNSRYQHVKSFQKINSMPGSQNVGHKDQLWMHLRRMSKKYGAKEYHFMPRTYVLPREIQKFENMWCKHGMGTTWIIKPPASGRGQGIKIVNEWWEIPKWHSVIIQRYITKPKLINGLKFDLRIYVLLTSIDPMRIYIYKEGLVRFASVRYAHGANLSDKYMHLTNSSVNKHNPEYTIHDGTNSFKGHKWTFASLWMHLMQEGVNVVELWTQIKDIVVKTLIAAEPNMNAIISENLITRCNCYELYGFDVLLDEGIRPWLLEVNILPSLQTNSMLDTAVKGPLIRNVLNMAGYQVPRSEQISGNGAPNRKYDTIAHDYRLYNTALSLREKAKQNDIVAIQKRDDYLDPILENLTRDDLRQLIHFEDELNQAENFEKIFPTKHSYSYFKFFEVEKYYDRLLDAWEHRYSDNRNEGIRILQRHCETMQHLELPKK